MAIYGSSNFIMVFSRWNIKESTMDHSCEKFQVASTPRTPVAPGRPPGSAGAGRGPWTPVHICGSTWPRMLKFRRYVRFHLRPAPRVEWSHNNTPEPCGSMWTDPVHRWSNGALPEVGEGRGWSQNLRNPKDTIVLNGHFHNPKPKKIIPKKRVFWLAVPSSRPSLKVFLEVGKVAVSIKSCPKDIGTLKKNFSQKDQVLHIKN